MRSWPLVLVLSILLVLNVHGSGSGATPPAAVKNLAAWYDASDNSTITATVQNVSQWTDLSGKGETLAQSTVSLQPTYSSAGMNGLGAMTFTGSDVLVSNDATFSQYLYPRSTVFIVQNSDNDSQSSSSLWSGPLNGSNVAYRYNLSFPSNGSCLALGTGGNGPCIYYDFGDYGNNPGGARLPEAAGTTSGTNPSYYTTVGIHLWMGRGQSGTSQILNYDGTTIGSQTPDAPSNGTNCALAIGGRGGCASPSSYFTGSIGEIVVYNAVLSQTNYQLVEGMLACKWGIQSNLPAGHPYAATCPGGSESTKLKAISGLSAWYDASNASTVTYAVSNVSQMNDKSGNGLTLTQATSGSQPSLATLFGAQAVVFNGSQILLSSTSNNLVTGATPSSMFIVSAYTGPTASYGENIGYGAEAPTQHTSRNIGKAYSGLTVAAIETAADVSSTASWSSSSLTMAYASFGAIVESITVNGGTAVSGTNTPATTATALRFGSDNGEAPWTGPIYEALIYNSILSTAEQQFIEGYLACKWGLQGSLPASHPYKSSCPVTATASLALVLAVSPSGLQPPATDLTYTTTFTNSSGTLDYNPTLTSPVPPNTWFKVGTATQTLGNTGLTSSVSYSNNSGSSYAYTPVSGAGGAASGYDATVTNVRWTLSGALGSLTSIHSGSVAFTARII